MSYSDDYFELKKKRKKEEQPSTQKYTTPLRAKYGISDEDIAPVKKTETKKTEKKEEEKRTWFSKGAFADGYQYGDVVRTISATGRDISEDLIAGALGIVENTIDTGAYALGAANRFSAKANKLVENTIERTEDYLGTDVVDGKRIADLIIGVGHDWAANKTKKFIEKDLIKEDKVSKYIGDVFLKTYGAPSTFIFDKVLGIENVGENTEASIFGDKTDSLVQSGGQLLGTVGLQALGVPWWVTTGVTSFGSGAEESFKEDATYGEAGLTSAIKAGADILTEKLFGGSGLGEKGLIPVDKFTKGISNKAVKALADWGIDIGTEGLEEVAASFISRIGDALITEKEDSWKEILTNEEAADRFIKQVGNTLFGKEAREEYLEAGIGGAVLGGSMNGGKLGSSIKNDRDYRTGISTSEEKVLNKVYEDALNDAQKDGKELTKKEKTELYDSIVEKMDKGDISVDTIEEILGGEDYKKYKEIADFTSGISKELDALGNKQNYTLADQYKYPMLQDRLKESQARRDSARAKLDETMSPILKNSRLVESYNEKARKSQAFEIDLNKYTGKQRAAYERAMKSGVLNNTNKSHALVDTLAKIEADKGIIFDYTDNDKLKASGFAVEGKTVNGFEKNGTVTLNVQSAKSWQSVVGHEITHVLEGTSAYTELRNALYAYAESKGELASRKTALTELYKDMDADIDAELTADLVGDYLFGDKNFISNLTANKNVFQKIWDEVKYLCKVATGKEKASIEKVEREFAKVWENFVAEDVSEATDGDADNVNYSLVEDQKTIDFLENQDYIVTYKAMVQIDGKLYPPMASQNLVEETYTTKKGETKTRKVRKLKNPSVLGKWQQSDERPDLVTKFVKPSKKYPDGYGQFDLLKSNGKTTGGVAYNPYEHTSNIVLNDQFAEAYQRPELVTVEYHIPVSELTSGYKAQYAKDSVGLTDWKAGGVAQKLKNSHRDVYLTRWSKPVRVLDDAEVAAKYKEILDKEEGISVPWNVVTPSLREELEKIGVPIDYSDIKAGSTIRNFEAAMRGDYDKKSKKAKYSVSEDTQKTDANYLKAVEKGDMETAQRMVDEVAKANGYTINAYHGTKDSFTVFKHGQENQYDAGYLGKGFYFTDKRESAEEYSEWKKGQNDKIVMGVALRMENPLKITDTNKPHLIAVQEALGLHLTDFGDYLATAKPWISKEITEEAKKQGYDGIVRYVDFMDETFYVVFDSNQVKSTNPVTYDDNGNVIPLSQRFNKANEDIRYSLSESVEETKNLIALHNLTESKLNKVMDLGGFPMPSIAVTRTDIPHTNFGDITLVMNKSTIDPKANRKNTVYSADAWTPTVPRTEYKPNSSRLREISNKINELVSDRKIFNALDYVAFDGDNVSRDLDNTDGNLTDKYLNNNTMKYAFLKDIGTEIELPTKEATLNRGVSNDAIRYFSGKLVNGLQTVEHYQNMSATDMMNDKELTNAVADALNWDVLRQFEEGTENYEKLKANPLYKADDLSFSQIDGLLSGVRKYFNHGIEQTVDGREAKNTISNYFNENNLQEQYETWLNELFDGVVEKTGIYNNKDIFTPSGNRRTFEQLHLPVTLENIVKAMASQNDGNTKNVAGFNGVKTLRAGMAERFKSIDDMHKLEGRLKNLTAEEFDAIHDQLSDRMHEVINRILETAPESSGNIYMRMDSVGETLMEIAESGNYSTDAIIKAVNQYIYNIDESIADDIRTLLYDVSQMPTNMFEAKPERAVGFDEVNAAILPNNADNALRERLESMGVKVLTYEKGNDTDRLNKLNSLLEEQPDWKFSLSKQGENIAPIGNYSTPLNETYLAPAKTDIAENATPTQPVMENVDAPIIDNKPPKSAQIADGTRGEELLNESLDNYPMETIEQKVAENIRAIEAEIADKKDLRREAEADYNEKIAKLQEQYNAKKNKKTKVAYDILQSITRQERLKASADASFAKRISDLEARLEKMKDPKFIRAKYKQAKMQEHAKWAADTLGDTSTWVDKKTGIQYATNTEHRNFRDIVRDENGNKDIARADAIDDALNGRYNREEANKKRELAEVRKKYADLKINSKESAYIQMLGELRGNPETTLTEKAVNEYYEQHKNKIDKAKVEKALEYARQDYDNLIKRVNAELSKQGMKEIPYRQGYFPHFTEPKQNFIQKLLNWKVQDNEIPTSIAGLTETFRPVKSWQSFDKTRYSDETDYDFLKGFDSYSEGALDWIHHLDTLQKRRAVENHIRFTHSDEGIQAKIKEVYANEEMDADEAQAQIEHILTEAKNPLNNFVQDFTTKTNILANKKNSLDRTVEQLSNRKIYSIMSNVQNRTSANMVLANVRSALTNFIPITQSWAQVSPMRSLQAAKDTIANAIKDDGTINKSTFLTNRLREVDNLYKDNWDKVLDKAGIMFEIVDNFSSQVIWRSKYNDNLAKGMSESQAIANADQFAENVMAGRSKGNEPTIFNAKNPFVKAFTMFQLEVNNQYGYLFKDVPNDLKAETEHWKFNLAKGYTTAFIGAYVYNTLLEQVAGSGAALDPIGIIEDLLKDLGLFDDDEEEEPTKAITNLAKNVVEELPFVGGLFGGGRIPINSALPYNDKDLLGGLEAFTEDAGKTFDAVGKTLKGDFHEADWSGLKNIGKEAMNPVLNVGLPVGGGQLKKTMQGLAMFNTDEDHPVMGSYTDSGALRFPVEDTLGNRIQAGIFGQWANENAREYIDNGYAPLKEKQIQEYMDVELPIADYWKYREGLKGLKKNEEKADYINSLDIEDWQKNLLMNNILGRKEDVDMTNYGDYSDWEEFDYAQKNPDKYAFAKSVGGYSAYKTYSDDLYDIKADKDVNGKSITGSRKEKVINYINNLDADYETKIILFKSEYPSDDTYNRDIINYLNNREDLTYDERVAIYTELGFTVKDGYVYW